MKAKEIMTADPFMVTPRDTVTRAAELMRDVRVGAVPVVQDFHGRELVGIITDRDIAVRCTAAAHVASCLVRDHMTAAPLHTAGPEMDIADVIEMMERFQVRRIPVVRGEGVVVGIIAQADIATKLGPADPRKAEEVVERISADSVALT